MIIEADGLFGGDRISACSNPAQLYYPRFLAAANGCGRLELNYEKLLSRCLKSLKPPPSREEVAVCFAEYRNNYLMFIYQSGGAIWGQFDTINLPRYKTRADNVSPVPDPAAYAKWLEEYADTKALKAAQDFRNLLQISASSQNVPKVLETCETFPKVSEDFGTFPKVSAGEERRGVGVGEEGSGVVSKNKEDSPEQLIDETPEGLHELAYADRFLEDLSLSTVGYFKNYVASAIKSYAKSHRISKAKAFDHIRKRAIEDRAHGAVINRFWFDDGCHIKAKANSKERTPLATDWRARQAEQLAEKQRKEAELGE